jgi:hypothetical protein
MYKDCPLFQTTLPHFNKNCYSHFKTLNMIFTAATLPLLLASKASGAVVEPLDYQVSQNPAAVSGVTDVSTVCVNYLRILLS